MPCKSFPMVNFSMCERIIAIGDIHGMSHHLARLLDEIAPTKSDGFVFLGDVINRGPNTKAVFELIKKLAQTSQVVSILGNHEEALLQAYQGGKDDEAFFIKIGGGATLKSFDVERTKDLPGGFMMYLASMVDSFIHGGFVYVHAGADAKMNSSETLRWKRPDFSAKHPSGRRVVCGHSVQANCEPFVNDNYICIDTGCGVLPEGRLTAFDVKTFTFWQTYRDRKNESQAAQAT